MDRRKHYDNNKIQENLYQYEMGIDLGAEIEYDKRRHEAEYDQNRRSRDFKGVNDLNPQQRNRRARNDQMNHQYATPVSERAGCHFLFAGIDSHPARGYDTIVLGQ